ncbi:50S ribosomal protein L29 [Candidatus Marinimicrobia bacterium]|jgi:large subunit ribosomal protein L29|nr:50S ribosomal protein L29 [Nitrosomonadales bacterium]MBT5782174.1 50S ribosomal protein L29 [Candidatus Neomarinimicrobiota bacterium]MDC0383707.1 50S ribosomal protein L29 [Candidatus Neomarinimicrobiota bacterium]MDC0630602.1 50S ribosomal protein L29 [Candidatus Neomarinimicrobiota bacterium]|tara:strand:- start:294 stop:518 length:225 start_codon:yes stop_codon:yes gene_type:complete
MKVSKLRELSYEDLEIKLSESLESLQNFKFQQALQQLEDGTSISKIKKEIAQLKTVIKEHNLEIRKIEGVVNGK